VFAKVDIVFEQTETTSI